MKKLLKKYGFTLVELIVVVVILAVLAALAFMMVSKWIGASKDSNRLSTIATIRRGIDMNYIEKGSYPFPDVDNEEGKVITGTVNGKTVLYKGTIGENVIKNLGNTLTKVPLDPIGKRYAYGITASGKEYEIGTVLENEIKLSILDKAYALNYKAKLEGTYGGMIVFSTGGKQYIANIPSLVFTVSGSVSNSMNMISNNIYYAINSGNNLPYIVTTKSDAQKDNMNAVIRSKTKSTTATVQSVEIPTATDLSTIFNGDVLASFGGNLGIIQNEIKKQSGQTTITSAPGTIQSCTCTQSNATSCEQIFDGNTWGTCSVKTCNSGYTVSGNSCVESACGGTPSGSTNNFYDVSSVPYVDNNCPAHMKTFTCDKGEWKDGINPADTATYQYLACSRGTPTNCTATTYNGYIIPDTTHALSGSATKDVIENNGTFRYTQNFECNNGTFNYTLETGPEYLSCNTNYNWNGTSCEAVVGVCGSANGQTFAIAPSTNLCNPGTPSAVSYLTGMGTYNWSCVAGTTVNCKAYDNKTILLLHFDGNYNNSGTNTSTITNNGSVTFSSAGVFGNGATFNGSNYLTVAASTDLALGTNDFTIEFRLKSSQTGGTYPSILTYRYALNNKNYGLHLNGGLLTVWIGDSPLVMTNSSVGIADSAWHHIAVVRYSGTVTIYIDGQSRGTFLSSHNIADYSHNILIGRDSPGAVNSLFIGMLDELRISKGIARWKANFTPSLVAY